MLIVRHNLRQIGCKALIRTFWIMFILGAMALGPNLASALLVNYAQVSLIRTLSASCSETPLSERSVLLGDTEIVDILHLAEKLSSRSGHIASLQGKLYLYQNNYPLAAESLSQAIKDGANDLLTEVAMAHACYQLGDLQCALTYFMRHPSWVANERLTSRYEVALATLIARVKQLSNDDMPELCGLLDLILRTDRTNIFALAKLADDNLFQRCGNVLSSEAPALSQFVLKSWSLHEVQMSELETVTKLLQRSAWTPEVASRVLSYLIWQDSSNLHEFLRNAEWLPGNPEEQALLRAEVALRAGNPSAAVSYLTPLISEDNVSPRAFLYLGRAYHQLVNLTRVKHWYSRYQEARPDALEAYGLATFVTEPPREIDDRQAVALILGIPREQVNLGDNLLPNSDFGQEDELRYDCSWLSMRLDRAWSNDYHTYYEALQRPSRWYWRSDTDGTIHSRGLFIGRLDDFDSPDGSQSIRLQGLWVEKKPGLLPALGTYFPKSDPELLPGRPYLFSFSYKTEKSREDVLVFIWLTGSADVFFGPGGIVCPLPTGFGDAMPSSAGTTLTAQ
jgi:tetratricopeptide (TPR) repeat protein